MINDTNQAGAELGQAQPKLGLKLKFKNVLCCSNSKMCFEDQFDIWYEKVDFEVWIWIWKCKKVYNSVRNCKNLHELVWNCETCKIFWKVISICKKLEKCVRICKKLNKFVRICEKL